MTDEEILDKQLGAEKDTWLKAMTQFIVMLNNTKHPVEALELAVPMLQSVLAFLFVKYGLPEDAVMEVVMKEVRQCGNSLIKIVKEREAKKNG